MDVSECELAAVDATSTAQTGADGHLLGAISLAVIFVVVAVRKTREVK